MITLKLSADKILQFMKENKLSQAKMAERMGIAANTLRAWMKDDLIETTEAKLRNIRLSMGSRDFGKIVVEKEVDYGNAGQG